MFFLTPKEGKDMFVLETLVGRRVEAYVSEGGTVRCFVGLINEIDENLVLLTDVVVTPVGSGSAVKTDDQLINASSSSFIRFAILKE
jgi:hypothetical protein